MSVLVDSAPLPPLPVHQRSAVELIAKLHGKLPEDVQAQLHPTTRPAPVPEEVINLHSTIRSKSKYSIDEAQVRNVLMVGRTRSGKSTMIGVLKDPCNDPKKMCIFSDPAKAHCQSFAINNTRQNTKYSFNIIDTPGLKEVAMNGQKARTDGEIMSTINACLNAEITKIHALVMVASFDAGITEDEVSAFKSYMEKFWNEGVTAIICITRAEDKTEKWRNDLTTQLYSHAYFKTVLDKPNMHLCFMGCVGSTDSIITSTEDLERKYEFVGKLRVEFLQHLFNSNTFVRLLDLPVTAERKDMVNDLLGKLFDQIAVLTARDDYALASNQELIKTFNRDLVTLLSWENLLYEDGINALFKTLKWQLSELLKTKPTLTPADKQMLRGPLLLD